MFATQFFFKERDFLNRKDHYIANYMGLNEMVPIYINSLNQHFKEVNSSIILFNTDDFICDLYDSYREVTQTFGFANNGHIYDSNVITFVINLFKRCGFETLINEFMVYKNVESQKLIQMIKDDNITGITEYNEAHERIKREEMFGQYAKYIAW